MSWDPNNQTSNDEAKKPLESCFGLNLSYCVLTTNLLIFMRIASWIKNRMYKGKNTPIILMIFFLAFSLAYTGSKAKASHEESTVKIGVLAFRPIPEAEERWQPLADYLSEEISEYTFKLKAFNYNDLNAAVESGKIDFVFTNPAHYIEIRRHNELSGAICTLVDLHGENPLSEFGGVIFTLDEPSAPKNLEDLEGVNISTVSKSSLGGFQASAYELFEAGIEIKEENILATEMPHDNAVNAVLDGEAEAGFVRTGVIESMVEEEKIETEELRIINSKKYPDFPYLASTSLYPEWPFVSLPHVDETISRRVASALLDLENDNPKAQEMGIYGFTIPAYYQNVEDMMRGLRIQPFDEAPEFNLADVWNEYKWPIIVVSGLIIVVLIMAFILLIGNKRLRDSEQRLAFFKHIFDSVEEGVIVVSREGVIKSFNPAASKIFDYEEANIIGSNIKRLFANFNLEEYDPTDKLLSNNPEAFDGKQYEFEAAKADGQIFPVEMAVTKLTYDNTSMLVCLTRDITERKEAQDKIERYAAELELNNIEMENLYQQLNEQITALVDIHESTFIKDAPQIKGISIASFFQPTDRLGGDLYGFIETDGKLVIYLSDVTGHGIESIVFNAFMKEAIESYISLRPDDITPEGILEHIDKQYSKENYPHDYFICIFLSVLDLERKELSYSGVGFQTPPLFLRQGEELTRLRSEGLPISSALPSEMMEFKSKNLSLKPKDTILFYTDGIAEEINNSKIYEERLEEVLLANSNSGPEIIAEAIKEDFLEFNNGSLQGEDDITFVIIQLEN